MQLNSWQGIIMVLIVGMGKLTDVNLTMLVTAKLTNVLSIDS
jgi:hypothetical protein